MCWWDIAMLNERVDALNTEEMNIQTETGLARRDERKAAGENQ